ncbi:lethal (3) L1231 [Carabus blaptoides fortunei]
MFNVTVKGNVSCNGIIPSGNGGMAKRGIHVNNSAMSPNRGHTISDTKLKFSDRLKAYLSTDGLRSDASEIDDPYTFSDSEVKPVLVNSVLNKKCAPDSRVTKQQQQLDVSGRNHNKVNNTNHHVVNSASAGLIGLGGVSALVNSGKTMSRLQAQIARNKVAVKHNRHSPELKFDKNYFDKNTKHSIIGIVNNIDSKSYGGRRLPPSGKPMPAHLKARRTSTKGATHHEGSLQRIPSTSSTRWHASPSKLMDSDEEDCVPVYQKHWFSKELELLSLREGPREARLEMTRTELKRQLLQMKRSKVGQLRNGQQQQQSTVDVVKALVRRRPPRKSRTRVTGLMAGKECAYDTCSKLALPCTKHCAMHIMSNSEQVLFDHCTAKFADNTQCSVPVFDIAHELPLCIEHARKRDNYNRMCLETKPKKPRRKIKPSAMIRPQKRNKKRKRSQKSSELPHTQTTATVLNGVTSIAELNVCETSSAYESSEEIALGTLSESEFVTIKGDEHIGDQDVVEQVLAMQDEVGADLGLVVEQTLVTQASRLLEESDFTNVLNQIPADEFNDLFADRNGEYEPSREETEELERALEAVDEDVKSLEKLSQTQGLLDSLLDEHTLVESLVQIPDVFHNGYTGVQCVDSPASPRPIPAAFHPALHGVDGMLPIHPPQAHTPS